MITQALSKSVVTIVRRMWAWFCRDSRPGSSEPIILTIVLSVILGTALWNYAKTYAGIDFYQFWIVPTAVSQGSDMTRYAEASVRRALGESYYERFKEDSDWRVRVAAESRRNLETLSTPFLYFVFSVFAGSDYHLEYTRFQIVTTVIFLVAVAWFALAIGYSSSGIGVVIAIFCCAWEPTLSDVRVANVNRFMLSILCLCILLRSPRFSPWVCRIPWMILGLSVMFKPVLIGSVFLMMWLNLVAGRWQALGGELIWFGAGAALAFVSSSAYFGDWQVWAMWAREFRAIDDAIITPAHRNYAPLASIAEWTGLSRKSIALGIVLFFCGALTTLWRHALRDCDVRDERSDEFYRLEIGACLGGILLLFLVSKLVWLHYIVLVIPLFIVFFRPCSMFSWWHLARHIFAATSVVLLGLETWRAWLGSATIMDVQLATLAGLICATCAFLIDQFSFKKHASSITLP